MISDSRNMLWSRWVGDHNVAKPGIVLDGKGAAGDPPGASRRARPGVCPRRGPRGFELMAVLNENPAIFIIGHASNSTGLVELISNGIKTSLDMVGITDPEPGG